MYDAILFIVGVVCLCVGADWLVRGAATIADAFHIPKSVAGLTLVALGTSAPELFVNIMAALQGSTDLAISNVSGSNLANICLGFGVCGLMGGLMIRRVDFRSDLWVFLVAPICVLAMIYLSNSRALPFLAVVPFTGLLIWYARTLVGRDQGGEIPLVEPIPAIGWSVVIFFVGIVGLYAGGNFVLDATIAVAARLNIGKDVLALTVVAIGTSVPDILATIVASRRNENAIAVGNILGSNISNIVIVLNGSLFASGSGMPTSGPMRTDYVVVLLVTGFCVAVALFRERLTPRDGFLLIGGYLSYLVYRIATLPAVS